MSVVDQRPREADTSGAVAPGGQVLTQADDRKRRLPVTHRGQHVPGLYTRPKSPSDKRAGETYEVVFRDETGKQRQKTLTARTIQRALIEAEEYRTQIRKGEVLP